MQLVKPRFCTTHEDRQVGTVCAQTVPPRTRAAAANPKRASILHSAVLRVRNEEQSEDFDKNSYQNLPCSLVVWPFRRRCHAQVSRDYFKFKSIHPQFTLNSIVESRRRSHLGNGSNGSERTPNGRRILVCILGIVLQGMYVTAELLHTDHSFHRLQIR